MQLAKFGARKLARDVEAAEELFIPCDHSHPRRRMGYGRVTRIFDSSLTADDALAALYDDFGRYSRMSDTGWRAVQQLEGGVRGRGGPGHELGAVPVGCGGLDHACRILHDEQPSRSRLSASALEEALTTVLCEGSSSKEMMRAKMSAAYYKK